MKSDRAAYYARPISIDGTPQEKRDIGLIYSLDFCPHPVGEDKQKAIEQYREIGMEAFKPYVLECAVLFFRAFPDGSIGAGVAKEIAWAQEAARKRKLTSGTWSRTGSRRNTRTTTTALSKGRTTSSSWTSTYPEGG